jgi:hypothetical protein
VHKWHRAPSRPRPAPEMLCHAIHPPLGSGVRATSGETPTTFTAALSAGRSSVSVVGAGEFETDTDTRRLFYFLTALADTAVTPRVLTYLIQIYRAVRAGWDAAIVRLGDFLGAIRASRSTSPGDRGRLRLSRLLVRAMDGTRAAAYVAGTASDDVTPVLPGSAVKSAGS